MISHSKKFILISPPKTGSTSLFHLLSSYVDFESVLEQPEWNTFDFYESPLDFEQKLWNNFSKSKKTQPRKHANLDSYLEKHIENYQIFCFIRNPFSRILSMWMWEKTVRDFVRGIDYPKLKFKEYLLKHTRKWYFKPQYEFIYTDSIDMNCINLIRFENLQEDFDIACDKIGIPQQKLPHKNKTNHKHYTEYYDDETREIVAEKYAKDIEYFGYEFGE